jgi:cytochrome c oxidase cbb3-type subunit III
MSEEDKSDPSLSAHAVLGGLEQDKVIHEYDGIREYDNRLPNWWLMTLFGSIVFAGLYWIGYHVLAIGELPNAEYQRVVAEARARAAQAEEEAQIEAAGGPLSVPAAGSAAMTPDVLVALSHDSHEVSEGHELFGTYCVPCHGPGGGGKIGPNLTDNAWIHGGAPEKIYAQITNGSPTKGMIAWGPQLGAERVKALTAFVLSIKNTNVPGGKPPQGEVEP